MNIIIYLIITNFIPKKLSLSFYSIEDLSPKSNHFGI